ncbi:MAG: UDP-glucose 4-epimerase GalE [Clostridia bacterium]|nr:UDP-glucose 4-epimerase GalE [Clostridia bacterium]
MTLVILAAGMGSRYGGLKQLDRMTKQGEFIIDFSVYDAWRAGFDRVVFIIKKENLELFKKTVGDRAQKKIPVEYAFQDVAMLPDGFTVPEGRTKPWGTGHALLCAKSVVGNDNMMVVNADDFYGRDAFETVAAFLKTADKTKPCFCMAGYITKNTLTEHGSVSRGVCSVDGNNELLSIDERLKIYRRRDGEVVYEENGVETPIDENGYISMNCWGLTPRVFDFLEEKFAAFLKENGNSLKAEFYLPVCIGSAVKDGACSVKVLPTSAKWYGVTYPQDKPVVVKAVSGLVKEGVYPDGMFGKKKEAILVTGGCGYIGSHTVVELANTGCREIVIVDNLYNSKEEVVGKLRSIVPDGTNITFRKVDVCDKDALSGVFDEFVIDTVIHFAGLKAVGESVREPLLYYRNNIDSTLTLLEVMKKHFCHKIIFSSSATVYGPKNPIPYIETMDTSATNPYGWTKVMQEQILRDAAVADPELRVALLRYFNPIGAHESGLIGEDPNGIPNNLLPYICRVAVGKLEKLHVFGNDYDTHDGTGVRDYIHVVDLAVGHVKALEYLNAHEGVLTVNLGTGVGYSVLDVLHAYEKACGKKIPYVIDPRRAGDLPAYFANADKAKALLGWTAEKDLDDMCRDAWRFAEKNM